MLRVNHNFKSSFGVVFVSAAVLVCAGAANGQSSGCAYQVSAAGSVVGSGNCFGFPGSQESPLWTFGLNSSGSWAGLRRTCNASFDLVWDAVIWTEADGIQVVPNPPETYGSWATAINDFGVVVGARAGIDDRIEHWNWWAQVWHPDGTFDYIAPLGGKYEFSFAWAVNNQGVVAGHSCDTHLGFQDGLSRAFIWNSGTTLHVDVSTLGYANSSAVAIDEAGVMVGLAWNDGPTTAFRWNGTQAELLQPHPGGTRSDVQGMNGAGIAVGQSRGGPTGLASFPAYWLPGETHPHAPEMPQDAKGGIIWGIADDGTMIGQIRLADDTLVRVVWRNGHLQPFTVEGGPTQFPLDVNSSVGRGGHVVSRQNQYGGSTSTTTAFLATPPKIATADLNGDCAVDGADLGELLGAWGKAPNSHADLNDDGVVNGADLGMLLGEWNEV